MARKRLVTGQKNAEKALTVELAVVLAAKLVQGFKAGGLIGPSQFVAVLLTYGGLALLVTVDELAEVGAVLGAIIMFATLLVPSKDNRIVGVDVLGALANASTKAAKKPLAESFAKPSEAGK